MIDLPLILSEYSELIKSFVVKKFTIEEYGYRIYLSITLKDDSILVIKDLFFAYGQRKYSFHWMDKKKKLIVRWDNAPHHQKFKTFPFHKHIGAKETLHESEDVNLKIVLEEIKKSIE